MCSFLLKTGSTCNREQYRVIEYLAPQKEAALCSRLGFRVVLYGKKFSLGRRKHSCERAPAHRACHNIGVASYCGTSCPRGTHIKRSLPSPACLHTLGRPKDPNFTNESNCSTARLCTEIDPYAAICASLGRRGLRAKEAPQQTWVR